MKRLFFSVFALTLGAFAFMSCDDEKIDNEGKDGKAPKGSFLTVPQQQQAIQSSLEGIADAVQFTEFANAMDVVTGIMGREIGKEAIYSILSNSPEILEDSLFQAKLSQALMMFYGDTIIADLTPYHMEVDLLIRDTMLIDTVRFVGEGGGSGSYVDTTYQTVFTLCNIKHDVNCFKLNVFVDEHEITFKADVKAGESILTVKDEKGTKNIVFPKSAQLSIALDGKTLATLNGQYQSDLKIYVEDVKDGDDIVKVEGSKVSVSGDVSLASYSLGGGFTFDEKKGIEGNMTVKYGTTELLAANAKLDAVFEGLDIQDTTAILVWAQNPEMLKSISLNASLAGGQVEFKGTMTSPFKDEELATTLRSLMVPGATISQEKAVQTVEKLNAIIDAGFYFEGYKDAQAKFKLIFKAPEDNAKSKGDVDGDEDGENPLEAIAELFDKTGAYPVLIAHDEEGNEIEVEMKEYFGKIDVTTFTQTITDKFLQAFGPILAELQSDEE